MNLQKFIEYNIIRKLLSRYRLNLWQFLSIQLKISYLSEGGFLNELAKNVPHKKYISVRQLLFHLAYEYRQKNEHLSNQYLGCFLHGFREDVIPWKNSRMNYHPEYYSSKREMTDKKIRSYLGKHPIQISPSESWILKEGYHRVFCMMGRLAAGLPYLAMQTRFKAPAALNVLNVGYRTGQNRQRLNWISEQIAGHRKHKFSVLDIGSNYGFFSSSLAHTHPLAKVVSVEGSVGTGNENRPGEVLETKGIRAHLNLLKAHDLPNNYIIPKAIDHTDIQKIISEHMYFDFQISFSVFHWIVLQSQMESVDEIENLLFQHLCCAQTTFLEVPDPSQNTTLTPLYHRYRGSVATALREIVAKNGNAADITSLGTLKFYGNRQTFAIRMQDRRVADPGLISGTSLERLFDCDVISVTGSNFDSKITSVRRFN